MQLTVITSSGIRAKFQVPGDGNINDSYVPHKFVLFLKTCHGDTLSLSLDTSGKWDLPSHKHENVLAHLPEKECDPVPLSRLLSKCIEITKPNEEEFIL